MSQSLNCPNCGAPSASDSGQCKYCGAALATVACASCMGSMFVGSQYCPHCGAKATNAETVDSTTLRCPGCAADMANVRLGDTPMYQCDKCGSAWLTPDTFAKLCADRQARAELVAGAGGLAPPVAQPTANVHYVICPICNKTMNRVNFARSSGVVINVCKAHGVWFERDQLREVLAFVDAGGLEKLHQDESTQRELREKALGFTSSMPSADNMADVMIRINVSKFGGSNFGKEELPSPLRALLGALFS